MTLRLMRLLRLHGSASDLPHAPPLLLLVSVVYLVVSASLQSSFGSTLTLPALALGLVVHLGLLFALLWCRSRSARFVQSALAVVSLALILDVLLWPQIGVLHLMQISDSDMAKSFLRSMASVLLLWLILVESNIVREAAELPWLASIPAVLTLYILNAFIVQQVFT